MYCSENSIKDKRLRVWYFMKSVNHAVPIEELYYCDGCQCLIGNEDLIDEVESYECFQCMKFISKRNVMTSQHCCHQCFDCPHCRHVLSYALMPVLQKDQLKSTEREQQEFSKKDMSSKIVLSCQYCLWNTHHLNIETNDTLTFLSFLWNLSYTPFQLTPLIANFKTKIVENIIISRSLNKHDQSRAAISNQRSTPSDEIRKENVQTSIWDGISIAKDCSRYMLSENSIQKTQEEESSNPSKAHEEEFVVYPAEEGFNFPWNKIPRVSEECPLPKPLHIKRSRRCKECKRYIIFGHPSRQTGFRINQSAVYALFCSDFSIVPLVKLKKFVLKDLENSNVFYSSPKLGKTFKLEFEVINTIETSMVNIQFFFEQIQFNKVNTLKCLTNEDVFQLEAYDEYLDQEYEREMYVGQKESTSVPSHRKMMSYDFQVVECEEPSSCQIAYYSFAMNVSCPFINLTCYPESYAKLSNFLCQFEKAKQFILEL